jgi:hypothetical protein
MMIVIISLAGGHLNSKRAYGSLTMIQRMHHHYPPVFLLLFGSMAVSIVVVLGTLGFSSSQTASAERDFSKCIFDEKGTNNCPKQQDKAFNRCIEDASRDGELTEDEYFACAYSIYG